MAFLFCCLVDMETATQQGHIGGVVVVDPSTAPEGWGFDTIRRLIEERVHLLPPFRRKLVNVPLDIDHPYWIEDTHFDLDFHLRHIAAPAPGSREELANLVARIHARPLDRSRPLWEMYFIEGLSDGRVATYTKLHHAAIDGVSGAEILTILLDPSPEGRKIPGPDEPWSGEASPSAVSMLARSAVKIALSPARAMRVGYELVRAVPGFKPLQRLPALVGLGEPPDDVLSRPKLIAPRSLLNDPITPHRRWAFGDVSLEAVKRIKQGAGSTVNDVVISVSAGAVRSWLLEHDVVPERSLQALIPISIRTEEDRGEIGNKVSGMIAPIGTHIADPLERLHYVHETMLIAKETHQATPATLLQDFAQFAAGDRGPGGPGRVPQRAGRQVDSLQPDHLQRAWAALPAVSGRSPTRGALSGVHHHRRGSPQHHAPQLLGPVVLRSGRRPGRRPGPLVDDGVHPGRGRSPGRAGGMKRPSIVRALAEPIRASGELAISVALLPFRRLLAAGDGHPVLVLPGFMASDRSTGALRRLLASLGYETYGWGLGSNVGPTERVIDELPGLLDRIVNTAGGSVSLIGWSLGGRLRKTADSTHPQPRTQCGHAGHTGAIGGHLHEQCLTVVRRVAGRSRARSYLVRRGRAAAGTGHRDPHAIGWDRALGDLPRPGSTERREPACAR